MQGQHKEALTATSKVTELNKFRTHFEQPRRTFRTILIAPSPSAIESCEVTSSKNERDIN